MTGRGTRGCASGSTPRRACVAVLASLLVAACSTGGGTPGSVGPSTPGGSADPSGSVAASRSATVRRAGLPEGAQSYADALVRAWAAGHRRAAARLARPAAVQTLFDRADPGWPQVRRTRTAGTAGSVRVTYTRTEGRGVLTLTLSNAAASAGRRHAVRRVDFGSPSASGSGEAGARSCPEQVLAGMGPAQRVGQLFVSGVTGSGPTAQELHVVHALHLGGTLLMSSDSAGVAATRRVARQLQRRASSDGVRLWVAADQEGGQVQRLQGPGFSTIPEALSQGRLRPAELRRDARRWGSQLHEAGVNMDLAPVLDVVPASLGERNAPIGRYHRELGHRPRAVARHGTAFLTGLRAAGVTPVVKHFPGLGRVLQNTDTSRDVVDDTTTPTDPYLRPFRVAVAHGARVVMVSSARYTRIDDRHLAAFSPRVLRTMLRKDLGFAGVIMSDDFSVAKALSPTPVGRRAVRFLRAGGSVVLAVDAADVPAMVSAVRQRARTHRHFRRRVATEALRVLVAKDAAGLLPCSSGTS